MDRRPSNEDKPQSKTGTLKPSLNQYFYWNTKWPWGAWATCPLKALVVTFFRKPAPMAFEERRMHHPVFTPLGNQCPCNTNTAQEIPGEFIHHVPTLHSKLNSPIHLGKMGLYNSAHSQCKAHPHKETCIWLAFTVTKFHFFHNQF